MTMYPARYLITAYYLYCMLDTCVSDSDNLDGYVLSRPRRQLLFPNSTLLQFNAGVGTPTPIKTINVNWAFQANFQLPWNRTQIPVDIFQANSGYVGLSRQMRDANETTYEREDYGNDARLYHFYKYVEDVLNGFGHNGSSCVLRTLCHLAAEPLHVHDDEDLLHELAAFVLNPESDHSEDAAVEEAVYVEAMNSGSDVENCFSKYDCNISFVDFFTKLNDT